MLVDKVNIIKEFKRIEHEKKEHMKAQSKVEHDIGSTSVAQCCKKRARPDERLRVETLVGSSAIARCDYYGRHYLDECWRKT